jgi:predicted transcriptional regulator
MLMPKKLIEIASEIVKTQVSLTSMSATDITSSLRQVFSTLHELQRAESGEIELPKTQESAPARALTPQDSIRNDKVICLECGAEMRLLTVRHLSSHGMSQKEYRKKYGFTMRTPLAAKSLTKARSKAAKKRGLPEKLIQYQEARRQQKAQPFTQAATEIVRTAGISQEPAPQKKPILTPENSIQNDKISCLECGAEMRQLTSKHLVSHGMNHKEYRQKYGFSMKTPLAAKSLVEAMSKTAKKRGLPENLKKAIEARKQATAKAKTPPESNGPGAQRVKKVKKAFSPKKMG